jgi:hypothetical protein
LVAGVVLGIGAAAVAGVFARRRLSAAPRAAQNPRLRAAHAEAIKALRGAGAIDADRRAQLENQLQTALDEIEKLAASGAPAEVLAERVTQFEAQAARLRDTARSMSGGGEASGALDDAIGGLQDEAKAGAELDEALSESEKVPGKAGVVE